jgi:hypothetical protein
MMARFARISPELANKAEQIDPGPALDEFGRNQPD